MCLIESGAVWEKSFCPTANRAKQQKSYVIKALLDLASFVCDNLTKKREFLEEAWTTDHSILQNDSFQTVPLSTRQTHAFCLVAQGILEILY
ncbi:hypothetical protein L596_022180 [Steinernema carpocapsae]|uniref:Uncharacterized protein n=1 Tax=Steinernema carpocapsae TaxID=34508 RepID=A0A4U5MKX9_STECR|nr:hypothetical protein L596_022180 [Steinernema carpocapsae]